MLGVDWLKERVDLVPNLVPKEGLNRRGCLVDSIIILVEAKVVVEEVVLGSGVVLVVRTGLVDLVSSVASFVVVSRVGSLVARLIGVVRIGSLIVVVDEASREGVDGESLLINTSLLIVVIRVVLKVGSLVVVSELCGIEVTVIELSVSSSNITPFVVDSSSVTTTIDSVVAELSFPATARVVKISSGSLLEVTISSALDSVVAELSGVVKTSVTSSVTALKTGSNEEEDGKLASVVLEASNVVKRAVL